MTTAHCASIWGCNSLRRLNPDLSIGQNLPNVTRAVGGACIEDSGCYLVEMYANYVFFTNRP